MADFITETRDRRVLPAVGVYVAGVWVLIEILDRLEDRYLLPEEARSPQKLFARVAAHYGDDSEHAQRIYIYISDLWFMPATPVLSNGGTKRGLPHVLVEVRQDLIATEATAEAFTQRLFFVLQAALGDMERIR